MDSPYLVSLRYLDKELFVDTNQTDETEFPVLKMIEIAIEMIEIKETKKTEITLCRQKR